MELSTVYQLARAMNFNDFKAAIAKSIDGVPQTVEHDNTYVVVNKKLRT